jgi:hypothetical protein
LPNPRLVDIIFMIYTLMKVYSLLRKVCSASAKVR